MEAQPKGRRLVIFGCGYVGTAVAEAALARGLEVTALTHNPAQAEVLRGLGLGQVVLAELDSTDWFDQIEPRQDWVLNCVSSAGGGLSGYRRSYLEGMASILDWASKGQVGRMIYTSSTGVYPQVDGEWVTEEDTGGEHSASGALLLEAERLLLAAPVGSPESRVVLRLGGIYGPNRHYLLDRLRAGTTDFPGSGDGILNLIHRDDVVAACLMIFGAALPESRQVFNLVDGAYPSKAEVVGWLAEQLGVGTPVFCPEQAEARVGMRVNARGRLPNRRISVARIKKALGWTPLYPDFRAGYRALL